MQLVCRYRSRVPLSLTVSPVRAGFPREHVSGLLLEGTRAQIVTYLTELRNLGALAEETAAATGKLLRRSGSDTAPSQKRDSLAQDARTAAGQWLQQSVNLLNVVTFEEELNEISRKMELQREGKGTRSNLAHLGGVLALRALNVLVVHSNLPEFYLLNSAQFFVRRPEYQIEPYSCPWLADYKWAACDPDAPHGGEQMCVMWKSVHDRNMKISGLALGEAFHECKPNYKGNTCGDAVSWHRWLFVYFLVREVPRKSV